MSVETVRRVLGRLVLSATASGVLVSAAAAQDTGQAQVTATVPVVVTGFVLAAGHAASAAPVPHVVVDTLRVPGRPALVRVTIFFE